MKMKITDLASRLRRRIIIEQSVESADGAGGLEVAWEEFATVWAEILPTREREELFAGQLAKLATHKITMRYFDGITTRMRINYDGRFFNIISILNVGERDETIEILAEEGVAR